MKLLLTQSLIVFICQLVFLIQLEIANCETYLKADLETNTYELIDSVFGGSGTVVEGK